MSVWLLIVLGVVAYSVLAVAFGSWLGRRLAQDRRGGYIDWTQLTDTSGVTPALTAREIVPVSDFTREIAPVSVFTSGDQAA